jgi:hypothetical protein
LGINRDFRIYTIPQTKNGVACEVKFTYQIP